MILKIGSQTVSPAITKEVQGNLQAKIVSPATTSQTYGPDTGYVGLSTVTVNAVTSAIDANITAANIKSGVSILGVSGSVTPVNNQTLTVTPTTSQQTQNPGSGYTGFSTVTVNAVTAAIDSNISANNIRSGVTILGVQGGIDIAHYYTGSDAPTASLGVNGDIYLQV